MFSILCGNVVLQWYFGQNEDWWQAIREWVVKNVENCVWMIKVKRFGEDVWITSFVMTASEVLYDCLRVLGARAHEGQWLVTTVILLRLSLSPVAVAEAIIQLSCFQHLVVDSDPEEWMQLIPSNGTKYPGIFHLWQPRNLSWKEKNFQNAGWVRYTSGFWGTGGDVCCTSGWGRRRRRRACRQQYSQITLVFC